MEHIFPAGPQGSSRSLHSSLLMPLLFSLTNHAPFPVPPFPSPSNSFLLHRHQRHPRRHRLRRSRGGSSWRGQNRTRPSRPSRPDARQGGRHEPTEQYERVCESSGWEQGEGLPGLRREGEGNETLWERGRERRRGSSYDFDDSAFSFFLSLPFSIPSLDGVFLLFCLFVLAKRQGPCPRVERQRLFLSPFRSFSPNHISLSPATPHVSVFYLSSRSDAHSAAQQQF